jgi:hypothetical protein
MNNKHLACVIIGLMICAQVYTVVIINGKAEAMKREAEAARVAADAAAQAVDVQTIQLTALKTKTAPLRKYLGVWDPYIRQSSNEERGQTMIDEMIRQGSVQSLDRKYNAAVNPNNGYIPKMVRADLLFEDDYHKSIQWLGEVERSFPASRVSKCRLTKGTNANDIKMELTIDLPISQDPAAAPAAPPKA